MQAERKYAIICALVQEKLLVDVARLKPGGEEIEGEVDAIDIAEEFVRPFGGIRYRLLLQVFGTELLVRGDLEQDFDLVCSRCGKDFDTTIKAAGWTASFPLTEGESEVDLTEEVREAILLELPNFPLCDESCQGLPGVEAADAAAFAAASPFQTLDAADFAR